MAILLAGRCAFAQATVPVITWDPPLVVTALSDQYNATANVPGRFTYYSQPGDISNDGSTLRLCVTFAPDDLNNYVVTGTCVWVPLTIGRIRVALGM